MLYSLLEVVSHCPAFQTSICTKSRERDVDSLATLCGTGMDDGFTTPGSHMLKVYKALKHLAIEHSGQIEHKLKKKNFIRLLALKNEKRRRKGTKAVKNNEKL